MSQNLIANKFLTLKDLKKTKSIKVKEKEHLYDLDIPTFTIYHKDYPDEYAYIRYHDIVRVVDGKVVEVVQKTPTFEDDCEELEFTEIENHFEYIGHLLEAFKTELSIEFTPE